MGSILVKSVTLGGSSKIINTIHTFFFCVLHKRYTSRGDNPGKGVSLFHYLHQNHVFIRLFACLQAGYDVNNNDENLLTKEL